jgi:hypothetical protein
MVRWLSSESLWGRWGYGGATGYGFGFVSVSSRCRGVVVLDGFAVGFAAFGFLGHTAVIADAVEELI